MEKTLGFLLKNQQGKDSPPNLYAASRRKKMVGMGGAVYRDVCDASPSPVPGWN